MGSSDSKRVRSPGAPTGGKRKVVRVRLLGGFRVSVGSGTIPQDAWRLRKAATLVKLLALASGHRVHREQAMDLLWPDSGRRAASHSLRSTLHAARKVLDPAMGALYLASVDESLVLCPEGDLWVDVGAFEQAAATARGAKDVFDLELADSTGELRVEYQLPYADPTMLSEERLRRTIEGESRWSSATPWRIGSAAR